jgi:hypothetical protein
VVGASTFVVASIVLLVLLNWKKERERGKERVEEKNKTKGKL